MFSMFGRTGAPTKRGPHKGTGIFLQPSNMPEIIIRRWILCGALASVIVILTHSLAYLLAQNVDDDNTHCACRVNSVSR